jgi:hypothetical protein
VFGELKAVECGNGYGETQGCALWCVGGRGVKRERGQRVDAGSSLKVACNSEVILSAFF